MDLLLWGELFTLTMLAIAISMDAFSLGIGVGMGGIRLLHVLKVSVVIGLFHFIMPLIGMLMGHFLSHYIGNFAMVFGGGLLIILGVRMVWSSFQKLNFIQGSQDAQSKQSSHGNYSVSVVPVRGYALFLFATGVSIDALSTGFSLGLFSVNIILAVILFGFWGMIMTMIGLLLGRYVGHWFGVYGEMVGGLILLSLGIKLLV